MTAYGLDDRIQENRATFPQFWDKLLGGLSPELFSNRLLTLSFILFIIGYMNQYHHLLDFIPFLANIVNDFYANLSSEILSIIVTVAILNRLYDE